MKSYTWNIVFMGMDLDFQDRTNNDTLLQTIQTGIDIFKNDVEDSMFNNKLHITLLKFQSATGNGNAIIYENTELLGKNVLNVTKTIPFNCLKKEYYEDFFTSVREEAEKRPLLQKYIVIFLAHSFGAGFLPIPTKKNGSKGYQYFTTVQLNEAINKGFRSEKNENVTPLNCFIGLNCGLQSVETNVVFQETSQYLISSQQPLPMVEVSYKELFSDLVYEIEVNGSKDNSSTDFMKIGIDNEIIYSKFIYNCYSQYKKKNIYSKKNKKIAFDDFSLSLTMPPMIKNMSEYSTQLLRNFLTNSNYSITPSLQKDIDYWTYASRFCMDPSPEQTTNIVDAIQFFLKLRTFYEQDKNKYDIITNILSCLRQAICFNITSSELCKTVIDFNNLMKMYIPNGLGMFLPKLVSANLLEVVKIYDENHVKNITLSFADIIENMAFIHNRNISYEDRTTSIAKIFEPNALLKSIL